VWSIFFAEWSFATALAEETPADEASSDAFCGSRVSVWGSMLGDRAYTAALHLNGWMNVTRRTLGYPSWSLSSMLKTKVKSAVNFINDFEHFVARYTRQQGCTGVICGHIHVPAIREIDGIAYYNCGDWVEHCTALVEHLEGTMTSMPTVYCPRATRDGKSHDVRRARHLPDTLVDHQPEPARRSRKLILASSEPFSPA